MPFVRAGLRSVAAITLALTTCGSAAAAAGARISGDSPPERPAKPAAQVWNGIDLLAASEFAPLRGLRIGLITNHTGTDDARNPTIDLLHCATGVTLAALFSPEHGIRGVLDDKIGDSLDDRTGLPVYSLYGDRRAPTAAQLHGLDALVFDVQDIGCRFYTYISTLGNCLEAAAHAGIRFFVLDRVNPITGQAVDGPVLLGATSFTGFHQIAVRHGMTVGELARMFNSELGWNADLTVIPLVGWSRDSWFDQTRLPWTNPSPNMRSVTEAILYPGVGILEMTNLSVGRGTGTPFEVVGAPYVNDTALAAAMNDLGIPGVRFVPVRFTPAASIYKDRACGGVSILLTDRERCPVLDIGIGLAAALWRLYPGDFQLEKLNRLLVHPPTVAAIREGKSLEEIRQLWNEDLAQFSVRRAACLLYP